MRSRGMLTFLVVLTLCCAGCKPREAARNAPDDLARYAALPGLSKTHHEALQAELARLLAEHATPQQLIDDTSLRGSTPPRSESAIDDDSAQARLDSIFPPNFRDAARKHLANVWPAEGFEFSPATLHVVSTLVDRYERRRERYEREIADAEFALPVNHALGLSADASYLDAVEIGHRLMGLSAAERIASGNPQRAVAPLQLMFHTSKLLAREKSLVARGAGALRRAEALQVLEAIAQHPAATPAVHRQLLTLLDQQLERWPDDAQAWIGDRAQGLHTYELVRDGYLLSLFTYEELRRYRSEVGIQELAEVVARNVDEDELFYLQTMREVIAACRRPHYERGEVFRRIESNLELLRGSEKYPFVADQLLLLQLDRASRMMALDRARCEAWSLALRVAGGETPPAAPINPLTGEPFLIAVTDAQVVVDAIDPQRHPRAAIVPRLTQDTTVPQARLPLRSESR